MAMNAPSLLGVSVLVVEDHDDTRAFAVFVLLDGGALVQDVATASGALTLARIAVPDVVIVDLDLPGADGYWLLGEIRGLPSRKRVAVIAATSDDAGHERRRALDAGFDAFLAKPFVPEVLVATVTALAGPEDQRGA